MLSLLRAAPWRALVLVSAAAVVSACEGSAGPAGAKGAAGTGCSVVDNGDGTKTVDCAGVKVTLTDGKNGTNGKDGKDGAAGAAGAAGKDGAAGAAGAAGTSCTAKKDAATGDVTISCTDGTSAVVSDGKTGAAGKDGSSCTAAKDAATGTTTVTCSDGTSATITDGKNGKDGVDGAVGATGTTGADGKDGSSCTAKDNGNGSKTISCTDGTTVTVKDGAAGLAGLSTASTGLVVTVKSVSTDPAAPITVNFTMLDDKNYPVDVCGMYSLNTVVQPRFGLAIVNTAVDNTPTPPVTNFLPYTVLTKAASTAAPTVFNPTVYNPLGADCKQGTNGQGTLVQNAPGDYTYTFPTTAFTGGAAAVKYDATKLDSTHVLWMQVTRQVDTVNTTNSATFKAVNKEYDFVPSGVGAPVRREIVATSACASCHRNFAPEGSTANAFHGGARVEGPFCNICHNGRLTSTGGANTAADSMVFIHRLHNSEDINPANLFHAIKFAFPQDIRNCKACHAGSAQPDQWKTHPTTEACTSCHDYVDFTGAAAAKCANPRAVDANGVKVMCNHTGGIQPDAKCTVCHKADDIDGYHQPVAPPDPNNIYANPTTGNNNTNAAYLAAAGFVPTGADVITYDLKEVTSWLDGSVRRPQMTFKFKKNGTDVAFQTYAAGTTTELLPNFVGSPSAYFVWAVPQDGIRMPADFNASGSIYIKNAWNGTTSSVTSGTVTLGTKGATTCTVAAPCTCAAAPNNCVVPQGTLTFDATSGYYTIKLNTVVIPTVATMLTGGLGYTYGLGTTQPLTQTNVPGYTYNTTTKIGGLIVAAPDVWMVATNKAATTGSQNYGYQTVGTQPALCADLPGACTCTTAAPCTQWSGRRAIVDNAACLNCHKQLGATPTFHAGQRNNGPSCVWCHTPNRTSSAWSANAKDFIHALHAGRVRSVAFMWHAVSPLVNFSDVEFPGALSQCTACHVAGGFDYSSTGAVAALPNMLASAVATGTFNNNPVTNSSGWFSISPYVVADNVKNYGSGFSVTAATGLPNDVTGTGATAANLIKTPITAACTACHDKAAAIDHMQANGGRFYDTRANMLAAGANQEQCLICHGPGKVAAIAVVHK